MNKRIVWGSILMLAGTHSSLVGKAFFSVLGLLLEILGICVFFVKVKSHGILDDLSDETSFKTVKMCRNTSAVLSVCTVVCLMFIGTESGVDGWGFTCIALIALPTSYAVYYNNCMKHTENYCHYPFIPLLVHFVCKSFLMYYGILAVVLSVESEFGARLIIYLGALGAALMFLACVMLYHGVVRESVTKVVVISFVLSLFFIIFAAVSQVGAWFVVLLHCTDIILSVVSVMYFNSVKIKTYYE